MEEPGGPGHLTEMEGFSPIRLEKALRREVH